MLAPVFSWYLAVFVISAMWLFLCIRRGPCVALGISVILSALIPVWIEIPILGQEISCRTALAIIGLIGYTIYRRGRILTPLTLLDVFITNMWLVHVIADIHAEQWQVGIPIRAYGEWILPYVAGRIAIQSRNDLQALVPWVVGILTVLCVCGLLESVSRVNLFEVVAGDRPIEGVGRKAARFGLKRAFGNAMHPIFFGNQLLLLAPWCFALIQKGAGGKRQVIGWLALLVALLGVCSSVSRGPVMAFLIMLGVFAIIRFKALRWPTCIISIAVMIVFAAFPSASLEFLQRIASVSKYKSLVEIDGKAVEYSNANDRLLIFDAYGDALRHAGLTGYGTELTNTFPPNIPYLQASRHSVERLKYVDNAYVLLTLRFGFLGLGAFMLLLLSGIYTAGCLVKRFSEYQLFPAMCGSLTGFAVVLMTVWLNYDFGYVLLWTLGILAGCAVMPNDRDLQERVALPIPERSKPVFRVEHGGPMKAH